MKAITLAEYRRLEPTLARPLTDTVPQRLPVVIVAHPGPSARDLARHQQRQANRRPTPRQRHVDHEQDRLGFRWDLTYIRPALADARATSRAMRGLYP